MKKMTKMLMTMSIIGMMGGGAYMMLSKKKKEGAQENLY